MITNQLTDYVNFIDMDRHHVIYSRGSTARGFYYVDDGLVGLYQVSEKGKETLLRIYGPGCYFGYRSLFTKQSYPATAKTMLKSTIVQINVKSFNFLQNLSPELVSSLMSDVCSELGEAEQRLMQFNSFNAKKRILDSLYYVFKTYPSYPWTYREIGEFSGTDTSTVIRYCKFLKQSGVLQADSRKLIPISLEVLFRFRNAEHI